jgi:putative flippase GtrA
MMRSSTEVMEKSLDTVPENHFQSKRIWRELLTILRFGIVGVMATAVHILVVWILLNHTHLPVLISNSFAFLTAFGVSFSGHYFWTFQNPGDPGRAIRRFLLISTGGFTTNTLFLAAMLRIEWLSPFGSVVVSVVVIPLATFLASRSWGFRHTDIDCNGDRKQQKE